MIAGARRVYMDTLHLEPGSTCHHYAGCDTEEAHRAGHVACGLWRIAEGFVHQSLFLEAAQLLDSC